MTKKEVVLRVDEKDYNLISCNKGKIAELVRFSMYILDMDEEYLTDIPDPTFQRVVDDLKYDYALKEFGLPQEKKAKLKLIKSGLKKEGR